MKTDGETKQFRGHAYSARPTRLAEGTAKTAASQAVVSASTLALLTHGTFDSLAMDMAANVATVKRPCPGAKRRVAKIVLSPAGRRRLAYRRAGIVQRREIHLP